MKRVLLSILTIATMAVSCKEADKGVILEKSPIQVTEYTPEVMHQMGKVSDPQISPDGTRILYGVGYTSIELNKSCRQLFIMNVDGSDNHQITHSTKSISNARWIENGSKIIYLCGGELYTMNPDGSNSVKVTGATSRINEFKLSPDEKSLIYVSEIKSHTAPTDVHSDLNKANVRSINTLMYRHWDTFVENIPRSYVASFDGKSISTGKDILGDEPFELPTLPFGGLEQLDWSPDSKYIAYSCRKKVGIEYAFSTNTDIYLYEVATGKVENLTNGMMGYDTCPLFSPDGKYIAWISMERDGYEADKERLFVIDLNSKKRTEISGIGDKFAYNIGDHTWTNNSKEIYFSSLVLGVKEIWKCNLDGKFTRVTPKHEWYDFGAPSIIYKDGTPASIITTNTSMMRPAEIVSISIADGSWKQISHENDDILAQIPESKVEERWIKTVDGKEMLTWVIYPPQFDATKEYPAILVCLGGPQGTISQSWSTRWNYKMMASKGYIVVLPNRRGTTAFGQEWCEQISGDYCGLNIQDYLTAADNLKAEPYVGKMAAVGASYGGYSVYYLAGVHKNRFSAFIAHCGIFNQEHMFMVTEESWFPNWDNGRAHKPSDPQGGAPWSDNPTAKRHYANSPHKLVKNWNTPIMVVHGEMDYRVPVDQGMAAFNAAQMMGVPSKMLLFPDENHWVLKPQNSVFWYREFYSWLDQWCK